MGKFRERFAWLPLEQPEFLRRFRRFNEEQEKQENELGIDR